MDEIEPVHVGPAHHPGALDRKDLVILFGARVEQFLQRVGGQALSLAGPTTGIELDAFTTKPLEQVHAAVARV